MNQHKGFTLIELMIVVVIVGILSAVGMGYYVNQVIAGNRTEARAALSATSGSLEKCRSLYGSYNNANCNVVIPFATETNYYTVSGTTVAATTFLLTATPVGGQPQANDADCTTLTLTNTGVKGGTGADPTACW